jgi:hypothetical protein
MVRLARLAGFRFGLGGRLSGYGLVDFEIGHLQFAEKIEEHGIFLGRQIAFGFFVKCVEHIDELASGFGIEHRLASARIGVGAEDHGGVAAQHANEIFKSGQALGSVDRRSGRGLGGFRSGRLAHGFAFGFALFLFDNFLAQFALSGEGATIYDTKRFFLLVVSQGVFLSRFVIYNFNIGAPVWVAVRATRNAASVLVKGRVGL